MRALGDGDDFSPGLQHRFAVSPQADCAFLLTVVEGPDAGRTFSIHAADPEALLGQSTACAMQLSDREASRRHASLEVVGETLRVSDLGSRNGTRVDHVS